MNPVKSPKEDHLSIDDLDRGIVNLAARINAATYELLVLVRQFDERAGWLKWGLANCAEWLHWRCDLSMSAAREKVRVAHALKTLPAITSAFSSGELSYSKVRSLTRVPIVTISSTASSAPSWATATPAGKATNASRPDATVNHAGLDKYFIRLSPPNQ